MKKITVQYFVGIYSKILQFIKEKDIVVDCYTIEGDWFIIEFSKISFRESFDLLEHLGEI